MTTLRRKFQQEVIDTHTRKIARLLYRETDIEEHIMNISSYRLSFFQKLFLCRGLKFALPQKVSSIDVMATFEKAYCNIEPHLANDDMKELTVTKLRSVALDFINQKGLKPPETLLKAIEELKNRDDIVITKPDKGSGVVVMDKSEYFRLLSEASINDTSKFRPVDTERPKTRGRPAKYYHPLLQREKQISAVISKDYPSPLLTPPFLKVVDLHTYMAYRRRIRNNLLCAQFSPLRILITMHWLSG